ncbi:Aldehyde/histidinol dehydrogenase [Suillus subalutaceus]|uniref:Aldehyde/histidinol dehydrogenase n=1 Tax=Suillus subalutaceus TaxID=48586 RepID=UPI001B887350|nr:Aldehyde/histidinol dehydrogenase [Suillus subalutaceus]KAG1836761.1 Aldehyde/histidinol dehydrogenase [Suillus subalutaceus]
MVRQLLHNHRIPNNYLEVVEQVNDTLYGFVSSVFMKDIDRAIRVAHALKAGTALVRFFSVIPSCIIKTEISMPFEGFKQSGIGRELSEYAFENYMNVKAVHVNIGIRLRSLRTLASSSCSSTMNTVRRLCN